MFFLPWLWWCRMKYVVAVAIVSAVMVSVVVMMMVVFNRAALTRSPALPEPPSDICAMRALQHPLLQRTSQRVQRLPGDVLEVNLEGASWRPWSNNTGNCSTYHTRFGRGLTPVLLVSLPCSGNTWLRYLVEGATGIFTGSRYLDNLLNRGGFLGEGESLASGTTLLHKTHGTTLYPFSHDIYARYLGIDPNLPTVLLLRDPARAVISFWKLYNLAWSDTHQGEIPEYRFTGEDFRDFVAEVTLLWEEMATDRLLWVTKPLYVLHFEDLRANPIHNLRRLLHFLSVATDESRLACVAAHLEGSFRRNASRTFDPFTSEEKARFSQAVKRVDNLLGLLGYPSLPIQSDRLW